MLAAEGREGYDAGQYTRGAGRRFSVNRRLTVRVTTAGLQQMGEREMAGSHAKPNAVQRLRSRTRRGTETSEYAAMVIRILYGYGARVGQDPAALAHLRDIENTLRDAVNLGIFTANRSGDCPYSLAEIAAVVGITRQGVHKRVGLGEGVFVRMEAARAGGALVRLADVRQARAAALAAAGVEDKTGSVAELRAASG